MTGAKPISLLVTLLMLVTPFATAQDFAPPQSGGTGTTAPTTAPSAPTAYAYYAYQIPYTLPSGQQGFRQGVWRAPEDSSAAFVSSQIRAQYPSATLVWEQPISPAMAEFRRNNPQAYFYSLYITEPPEDLPTNQVLVIGNGWSEGGFTLQLRPTLNEEGNLVYVSEATISDATTGYQYNGPTGPIRFTTNTQGQITGMTYGDRPVTPFSRDGTLVLLVLDRQSGTPTGELIQPVQNGAIIISAEGNRRVQDVNGNTLASVSAARWQTAGFTGNEQNIVAVAQQFSTYGGSLNNARFINGQFVYDGGFLGLGSGIVISQDGGTVSRGTLQRDTAGQPTGMIDTRRAYTTVTFHQNNVDTIVRSSGPGGTYATFDLGRSTNRWSVSEGTVDANGNAQGVNTVASGDVVQVNNRRAYSCGEGVCVLADSGNVVDQTTGAAISSADLTKKSSETQNNVKNAQRLPVEEAKAKPGIWERLLTQGNILSILNQLFTGYEQWAGLGAYGAMFIGDEELAERRARVTEQFCKFGLGIDCLTQKFCERHTDRSSGGSVIVSVVPGQAVRAVAYVQSERSGVTTFENQTGTFTEYLYKTTFYAASPDDPNQVQLIFNYDGGSYSWYPPPGLNITEGGSVGASGAAALIKYSKRYYTSVCLQYTHGIDTGTGGRESRTCSPIADTGLTVAGQPVGQTPLPGESPAPAQQPGEGF